MTDAALRTVYRATAVAKILCAAKAWWSFSITADRQRIRIFLRRSVRVGYASETHRSSHSSVHWLICDCLAEFHHLFGPTLSSSTESNRIEKPQKI
jgi:hypothetical protein